MNTPCPLKMHLHKTLESGAFSKRMRAKTHCQIGRVN
jgi:hypothetical protein